MRRTGGGDGGLHICAGHGDWFVGGHVEIELFVEIDEVLLEAVFKPELAGNLGLESAERDLVFENVAHAQALDRDMLLVDVGVHGRFARHIGGHVLNVVIGRRDDEPSGLMTRT